jgi:hypothetical protein
LKSPFKEGQNESIVVHVSFQKSSPPIIEPGLNTPEADITNRMFFSDSGTASAYLQKGGVV